SKLEDIHARNARATQEELEKFMRPELINRLDGVVTFRALTRPEVGKIFDLLVEELRQRLVRQSIGIHVTPAAKKYLIGKGYSTKFGARPLRRTIEDELEHRIAEGILGSEYQKGAILEVRMDKGVLQIEPRNESDK
nr:ATP-dependent Clp protease ATP-binding subunit [Candidatus Saccharimonas sp.]